MAMRKELEGKSIEELLEMIPPLHEKMALALCSMITNEIDNNGTKVNVRKWAKSLKYVKADMLEEEHKYKNDVFDLIIIVEREAEQFLFMPKKIR